MKQVKCVKLGEDVDYLTEGKIYDVNGFWEKPYNSGFYIRGDDGETVVCSAPQDLHAKWEIVA